SSRSTITSSLMQTYCCLRREPQVLCSMLKEIAFCDWVAVNSFTGIATSPKETVSEPMERGAAIKTLKCVGLKPDLQEAALERRLSFRGCSPVTSESVCKALFLREPILPPVGAFF